MNKKSYLVTMRWTEPEIGSHAFAVSLTDDELSQVKTTFKWLEEQAGADWGDCIPAFLVIDLNKLTFLEAMKELRLQSRYEEDGVYKNRYHPFDTL